MIKINPSWSEPNGSWKSFVYKMVHDAPFRGDIIAILLLWAIIAGPFLFMWPGLLK